MSGQSPLRQTRKGLYVLRQEGNLDQFCRRQGQCNSRRVQFQITCMKEPVTQMFMGSRLKKYPIENMSNRLLRDWTESEKIDKICFQAEVFFTRLIMKADDYGCYRANEALLKSSLFPLKDNIRNADILRWLDECQKAGLIVVYEVSSKRYLQILDFGQRKRQMTHKYPLPKDDSYLPVNCQTDDSDPPTYDGLKGREVEDEVEEKGKAPASEEIFLSIEELMTKNPILFEQTLMNAGREISPGREILKKYHLHLEERNRYPMTKNQLISGFKKWLMNEKNFEGGTHQQSNRNGTKTKPGTSEARIEALKKW